MGKRTQLIPTPNNVGSCYVRVGSGVQTDVTTPGGRILPYKGLMGTCGQAGYVFRDFCLKQGIDFILFCLSQGIDFINFCLEQGTFYWTINGLRVCSTNVLNSVSKIGIVS